MIFHSFNDYEFPIQFSFLCGCEYRNEDSDKRFVLSKFLNTETHIPLIIEQYFTLKENEQDKLSYIPIGFYGLASAEMATAFLVDYIFIIHETFSTAAELGLFASNINLVKKICLISPNYYSVFDNYVSTFIKDAFLNNNDIKFNIGKHIIYYPACKFHSIHHKKSTVYTYFPGNIIPNYIQTEINTFINKKIKSSFYIPKRLKKQSDKYSIHIPIDVFKIQIVYLIVKYKKYPNCCSNMIEYCDKVHKLYTDTMLNTLKTYTKINFKSSDEPIYIYISKFKITSLKKLIGMYLYLLHSSKLITLSSYKKDNMSCNIIKIKKKFKDLLLKNVIVHKKTRTAYAKKMGL